MLLCARSVQSRVGATCHAFEFRPTLQYSQINLPSGDVARAVRNAGLSSFSVSQASPWHERNLC